jgi:hypothetical protein
MAIAAFPARLQLPFLPEEPAGHRRPQGGAACGAWLVSSVLAVLVGICAGDPALGAEDAPRIVVLDALALTPPLERAHTRSVVETAVVVALRQQGWDAVESPLPCRNIGCAQEVARAAKAEYVLILVGRFVPGESYAADLGASLWRDDAIVADWSESDEIRQAEDRSRPASILLCGPPAGACTTQLLTAKLQRYAEKLVVDELAAIHKRQADGELPKPALAQALPIPVRGQTQDSAGRRKHGHPWGWVLLGTGAALAGGAAGLWALNNTGTDCHPVVGDNDGCRQQRRTGSAALALGAAALATVGAAIFVFSLDHGPSELALSIEPAVMTLTGRF